MLKCDQRPIKAVRDFGFSADIFGNNTLRMSCTQFPGISNEEKDCDKFQRHKSAINQNVNYESNSRLEQYLNNKQ